MPQCKVEIAKKILAKGKPESKTWVFKGTVDCTFTVFYLTFLFCLVLDIANMTVNERCSRRVKMGQRLPFSMDVVCRPHNVKSD